MERQDYLKLRLSIHQEVLTLACCPSFEVDAVVNNLMRVFLQSISDSEVKRQVVAQQFRNFQRNKNVIAPSWAYSNPGLSSRLPTIKEA